MASAANCTIMYMHAACAIGTFCADRYRKRPVYNSTGLWIRIQEENTKEEIKKVHDKNSIIIGSRKPNSRCAVGGLNRKYKISEQKPQFRVLGVEFRHTVVKRVSKVPDQTDDKSVGYRQCCGAGAGTFWSEPEPV